MASLRYFLLTFLHLHKIALLYQRRELFLCQREHIFGRFLKSPLLIKGDIVQLTFGKPEDDECRRSVPKKDDRPVAFDLPWPALAIRCLITLPPRSASIWPFSARATASHNVSFAIPSLRAKR
jgi:hypothetical protein